VEQLVIFFEKIYKASEIPVAADNNCFVIIWVLNCSSMEYKFGVNVTFNGFFAILKIPNSGLED